MKNRTLSRLFGVVMVGIASSTVLAADVMPATVPAPVTAAQVARSALGVEVFPFTAVSGAAANDWTGRGIQENLQSDISRTGATLLLGPKSLAATDDPIAIARQNHADLAVTGSYQVVGNQIRANGHLIDVANNATVGGFTATGSQADLFKVEDALGEQLRALLPRPMPSAQAQQAMQQQQQPAIVYQQQPAVIETPAPVVNNYYDDTPPAATYYYPDNGGFYDYPYGVFGGFGFVSGGGRGFINRGFNNRGFSGGSHFVPAPAFRGSVGGGRPGGGFSGGFHGGGGGGGFHGGGGGGGHR
jgi:TolB-like protein